MVVSGVQETVVKAALEYDRTKELKAFDETKAELNCRPAEVQPPVVEIGGIQGLDRRKEIVNEVRIAAAKWGFFQVVGHGIPLTVLEEMIEGVCLFHEQDLEARKEFYSRDSTRSVRLNTNFDLFMSSTANWRDTLIISVSASGTQDPNEFPAICR
ncbi:hypothetical protein RJ639_002002 [Escallonia herrerae]|uniref:Non-haem dioxygenase N-terminal domain-containing protein n=1 Tax=Escallonia herrerae TaxID=1293975 RepID=A0AA89BJF7_9ASTE|nr:hypothetical protein RJ639_002002 [Escallonia herrerae]